jgi:hypothetical protein
LEQGNTQTIATFTGTLLKREQTAGRFLQLVFREAEENWLCLTSNLANAKLEIGKTYHIEGTFRQLGSRQYIHEPEIELVKGRGRTLKRIAIGIAIILLVAGATAFADKMIGGNLAPTSAATQQQAPPRNDNTAVGNQDPGPSMTKTANTTPDTTSTTPINTTPTPKTNTNTTNNTQTNQQPTDPGTTQTDPGTTDPGTTDPGTTDPGTTPTDPGPDPTQTGT